MRWPFPQNAVLGWGRRLAILWLTLLVLAASWSCFLPSQALAPDLLNSNEPPLTAGHWLGTDPNGQDVWTSLLYGGRTALLVSLPAAVLTTGLGTGIGLLAGYWGNKQLRFSLSYWVSIFCSIVSYALFTPQSNGITAAWWPFLLITLAVIAGKSLRHYSFFQHQVAVPLDRLVLAGISLLAALPRLLLVLAVASAFEPTLFSLVLLLTLTSWPQSARLVRAAVSRVQQLPYMEAAHSAGLSPWRIIRYHLLPNTWGPVLTTLPLSIAGLISLETTLSFLGVGLPPETPSWGRLLALSRLAPSSWWLLLFPGLCLLATTLSLRQILPISTQRNPA